MSAESVTYQPLPKPDGAKAFVFIPALSVGDYLKRQQDFARKRERINDHLRYHEGVPVPELWDTVQAGIFAEASEFELESLVRRHGYTLSKPEESNHYSSSPIHHSAVTE